VNPTVEGVDTLFQFLLVFVPSHPIHARCCLAFELVEALGQQLRGDMMQQGSEFEPAVLAGGFAHASQSA
jgi:hypothetical protein